MACFHKVSGAHDQACCPSIQGLASGINRSWQHLPPSRCSCQTDHPWKDAGPGLGSPGRGPGRPWEALPPRIHPGKNQPATPRALTREGKDFVKGSRGELLQLPGLSWVLQYPWLWEGRRATWIDLRHRCRGA